MDQSGVTQVDLVREDVGHGVIIEFLKKKIAEFFFRKFAYNAVAHVLANLRHGVPDP